MRLVMRCATAIRAQEQRQGTGSQAAWCRGAHLPLQTAQQVQHRIPQLLPRQALCSRPEGALAGGIACTASFCSEAW